MGEGTKVSQEAERARGKKWSRTFIVISIVKERKGSVNVTLSNFIDLWPVQDILSCLGPGSIRAGQYYPRVST